MSRVPTIRAVHNITQHKQQPEMLLSDSCILHNIYSMLLSQNKNDFILKTNSISSLSLTTV